MDINRNQFFLVGAVLLFLGTQFRMIDTVSLTPECTRLLAARGNPMAIRGSAEGAASSEANGIPKTVRPPDWLGWALLSVGAVLVLHSLGMKGPGS